MSTFKLRRRFPLPATTYMGRLTRRARRGLLAFAVMTCCALCAAPAQAQDATWRDTPGSGDFNTDTNWENPATVPTGTAFFGTSDTTNLSFSADTTIGGWTFNAGADDFEFTNGRTLTFDGVGIVINGGSATITNDNILNFNNGSTAGSATITNDNILNFNNGSTAGSATITNNSFFMDFNDSSTAGSAIITNTNNIEFHDISTAGRATITNDGHLVFYNTSTAGSADIANNGQTQFRGTSTAGTATISNDGDLLFLASSTAGNATITNNNRLDFIDTSNGGQAQIITSAGTATNFALSDGLLGNNELTAGSLAGAGNYYLGANQLTVGGNNLSTEVSGVISDCGQTGTECNVAGATGGSLVKIGTGTFTLSGNNTYTGPTTVDGGTLAVNGSIVSPVTVNDGGTLGGSGSFGGLMVNDGGVYAPGNSIGTQTVNGDFTLAAGAVFEAEVNAAGESDKVIVNGTVNLTGATLRVLAEDGAYAPSTDYTIVENDGTDAVVGEFADVTANLAFLTPFVAYAGGDGNDVVLTLERVPFEKEAETPNEEETAEALNSCDANDALCLALLNLTPAQGRGAFNALSGEIHATVAGALADDSRYVREAVLGRLMQASHSGEALSAGGPQVAGYDGQAMMLGSKFLSEDMPAPAPAPLAFWTRAFGAWGDFDGNGNAASADRELGGFVSGMDAAIGGSWRAGIATGASFSNVSVDDRYSSADVESYHLGGYLGGLVGPIALRGGGMWAWNSIDTFRAVMFPGFFERQKASYDADTGQLFGEIAFPTQMGGVALEPFGGLAFISVETDSFRETGGQQASLRGSADQDVGYSTVGLRAATTMMMGGMQVVPHVSAAWLHAFDDVTPAASLAFASTGAGFAIDGVPLAEDSALLDAGLDFALGENATAGVSYTGQFGDGVTDNGVKGRFTWLF